MILCRLIARWSCFFPKRADLARSENLPGLLFLGPKPGLALIGLIEGIGGADEMRANALAQFHQLAGMRFPLMEQLLEMLSADPLPVRFQLGNAIADGRDRVVFNLLIELIEAASDIAHDIGVDMN